MFYPASMNTCNATHRERGKLLVCEKPLDHPGNHRDDTHEWTQDKPLPHDARIL